MGEPWPHRQLEVIAQADAALCRFHGWGADRVIGHKEFAPRRKSDPTYDMNAHRAKVAALLKGGAPTAHPITIPPTSEEDDMADLIIICDGEGIYHKPAAAKGAAGVDLPGLVKLRDEYAAKRVPLVEVHTTPGGLLGYLEPEDAA